MCFPKAFGLPDSDPEHGYLQTSFLLWAGIWLFFMIERFLKIIMDAKQRNNQQNNPTQTKNSWPLVECKHSRPHPSQSIQQRLLTEKNSPKTAEQGNELCAGTEIERIYESQEQAIKASFGHQAVCFVCFFDLSKFILSPYLLTETPKKSQSRTNNSLQKWRFSHSIGGMDDHFWRWISQFHRWLVTRSSIQ